MKRSIFDYEDRFHPPFYAISRKASLGAATLSMITTCLDGTILSIPYLMFKTGLLYGTISMMLIGFVSTFTLFYLSVCAKKLRSVSFTEIIYRLLGQRIQMMFSMCLFLILFSIMLGYFILMKNILQHIIVSLCSEHYRCTEITNPVLLTLVLLVPIFPLMLIENMERLKFVHFLGFFSIVILVIVMIVMIVESVVISGKEQIRFMQSLENLKYGPDHYFDLIEGVSIISLLYLNHFNFFSLLSQLNSPTPGRIKSLILWTGIILTVLFLSIGYLGTLLLLISTSQHVEDNILVSLTGSRKLFISRVSTLVALMCTVPNMMTPTRNLLKEFELILFKNIQRKNAFKQSIDDTEKDLELLEQREFPSEIIQDPEKTTELTRLRSESLVFSIDDQYISSDEEEGKCELFDCNRHPEILLDATLGPKRTHQTYGSCDLETVEAKVNFEDGKNLFPTAIFIHSPQRKHNKHRRVSITSSRMNSMDNRKVVLQNPENFNPPKIIQDLTNFGFGGIESTWKQYNLLPIEILSSISEPIREAIEETEMRKSLIKVNNQEEINGTHGVEEEIVPSEGGRKPKIVSPKVSLQNGLEFWNRVVLTVLILSIIILLTLLLPSHVAIVWEVIGSLISPWIALILPAVCFIKLQHLLDAKFDLYVGSAWLILMFGLILFLICTFRILHVVVIMTGISRH